MTDARLTEWLHAFTRPLRLRLALALWLPAAVAATLVAGSGYAIGQHVLRSDANDPQIQIAQDAAERLAAGATPAQVAGGPAVDLGRSLGVSVAVFGADGHALASTARLDGLTPAPPLGALRAATTAGMNVVTWQPRPRVRQAAVIVPFAGLAGSGSVVVARSLRLVEQREDEVLALAVLGWLLALGGAAGAALLAARLWSPPPPPPPGDPVPAGAPLPPPGRTAPGTLWRGAVAAVYRWLPSTPRLRHQHHRGSRPDSSVGRASPW